MFSVGFKWGLCRRYLPFVSSALVTLGVLAFLRHVPWLAIRDAFASADIRWMCCVVVLTFVNLTARSVTPYYFVRPTAQPTLFRSIRYTLASITGNIIAPFRAGMALRAWLLVRHEKLSVSACVGVYICEKIGDVASLLVLAVPLPWLIGRLPRWAYWSICTLASVLLLCTAAFFFMRGVSWWTRIICRLSPLGTASTLIPAAFAIMCAWLVNMLMVMAALRAVGAQCSFATAAFILLAINLAITIPTPANGGTLELGALVALHALGVDPGKAIAFAVLYHAAQVLPVLAVGVWDGPMLWQTGFFSMQTTSRANPGPAA